ncbi:hypothetical protein DUNSADRAFT_9961 [Dunaliella salina]|uniref:Uncharacterized protein n=1 Tax=Dunaliella salina TaxID=3046 RepID=A0ABQ7GGF5_DUNSA|nr:hypothetical protein DUNSADRAFT_9961 [Dunaliella salina]|eukprot:KAF5833690.1 hypothetical protein DUNSADRAFT_9961 [Dunaliella salina]
MRGALIIDSRACLFPRIAAESSCPCVRACALHVLRRRIGGCAFAFTEGLKRHLTAHRLARVLAQHQLGQQTPGWRQAGEGSGC